MGQFEVYMWLKTQFESGNLQWFTTQEIIKGLRDNGLSNGALKGVRVDCIKLVVSQHIKMLDLDKTGFNNYNRVFRYEKIQ